MSSVRILVTVGTHEQPFQRLLDAVALVAASDVDAEWVVQYGLATFDPRLALHAEAYLDHSEILTWNKWADMAIGGGSPGSVFDAITGGAAPFIVPRRHHNHEHVNDHQVEFAQRMTSLGLATYLPGGATPTELAGVLTAAIAEIAAEDPTARAVRIAAIAEASRQRTAAFVAAFADAVEPLLEMSRRRRS